MATMTQTVWRRSPAVGAPLSAPETDWPQKGILAAMAIVVSTGCAGCQSSQAREEKARCPLTAGMTTEELANCGCFSTQNRSGYAVGLTQEDAKQGAQGVDIMSYFCPIGAAGIARVVVVNGIAKDIYR